MVLPFWRRAGNVSRACSSRFFSASSSSAAPRSLSSEERKEALSSLGGSWSEEEGGGAILKTYEFDDFVGSWSFMSAVALAAEKRDHHPEWFNVYNRVEVRLTTHDCGGVSEKDVELARFMDKVSSS